MATRAEKEKKAKRQVVSAMKMAKEHKSGFSRTSIDKPEGVDFFSIKKEGSYRIDIIPYEVGERNPDADKGSLYFCRTYFAHPRIGVEEDTYLCLAKNFGKACPICEARTKMARDPDVDEEETKALMPKERQLFNVIDLAEPDKGIQIWDVSFHLFLKHLLNKIKSQDDGDGYDLFHDLEDGKTIKIGAEPKKFAGNTFFEFSNLEMKDRKTPYDESMIEEAHCLDDLLIEMEYDQLKAIFEGEVPDEDDSDDDDEPKKPIKKKMVEEDEDDEPPVKKTAAKKKPPVEDDDEELPEADSDDLEDEDEPEDSEDEDDPTAEEKGIEQDAQVKHKTYGVCKVIRVSKDGTSLTLEDEDGELYKAVAPRDCTVIEEEAEEEEETPKKKAPAKKPAKAVEEDESEDEDDLPAKPAAKKKPALEDWDDDTDELPVKKPTKKTAPVDEDEESDDEDEPPVKKAVAKKPAGKTSRK